MSGVKSNSDCGCVSRCATSQTKRRSSTRATEAEGSLRSPFSAAPCPALGRHRVIPCMPLLNSTHDHSSASPSSWKQVEPPSAGMTSKAVSPPTGAGTVSKTPASTATTLELPKPKPLPSTSPGETNEDRINREVTLSQRWACTCLVRAVMEGFLACVCAVSPHCNHADVEMLSCSATAHLRWTAMNCTHRETQSARPTRCDGWDILSILPTCIYHRSLHSSWHVHDSARDRRQSGGRPIRGYSTIRADLRLCELSPALSVVFPFQREGHRGY